jgi:hypothetical protein
MVGAGSKPGASAGYCGIGQILRIRRLTLGTSFICFVLGDFPPGN